MVEPSPMSKRRLQRLVFPLLLIVLVAGAIELLSFIVYRLAVGAFFSYGQDAASRRALIAERVTDDTLPITAAVESASVGRMNGQVIHPYLGYVMQPVELENQLAIGPWGFHVLKSAPPPRDDAYRIGVLGGSVAFLFSFTGAPPLIEALEGAPLLEGRPIEIVSLALGGMKQPQQLMTTAWMLSVGERFDLIVNIDGFNEVAFGGENARRGVYPAFPRNWSLRVSDITGLDEIRALGRASAWSGFRRRAAGFFDHAVLSASVTANLIWRLVDRAMSDRQATAEALVAARASDGLGYIATGPGYRFEDDDAMYTDVAGHWARASIALDRLCRGYGIRYVHLLQPNQYVPDSKPMGARERARAFDPEYPSRGAVLQGYPKLREAAERLRAEGVDFHDLTGMFRDERRAVYSDTCCHFNRLGNALMAKRLAAILR